MLYWFRMCVSLSVCHFCHAESRRTDKQIQDGYICHNCQQWNGKRKGREGEGREGKGGRKYVDGRLEQLQILSGDRRQTTKRNQSLTTSTCFAFVIGFDADGNYNQYKPSSPSLDSGASWIGSPSYSSTISSNSNSFDITSSAPHDSVTNAAQPSISPLCHTCQRAQEALIHKLALWQEELEVEEKSDDAEDEENDDGNSDNRRDSTLNGVGSARDRSRLAGSFAAYRHAAESAARLCAECEVMVRATIDRQDEQLRDEFIRTTDIAETEEGERRRRIRWFSFRIEPIRGTPKHQTIWQLLHAIAFFASFISLYLLKTLPYSSSSLSSPLPNASPLYAYGWLFALDSLSNLILLLWHIARFALDAASSSPSSSFTFSAEYFQAPPLLRFTDIVWTIAEVSGSILSWYYIHDLPNKIILNCASISIRVLMILLTLPSTSSSSKSSTRGESFELSQPPQRRLSHAYDPNEWLAQFKERGGNNRENIIALVDSPASIPLTSTNNSSIPPIPATSLRSLSSPLRTRTRSRSRTRRPFTMVSPRFDESEGEEHDHQVNDTKEDINKDRTRNTFTPLPSQQSTIRSRPRRNFSRIRDIHESNAPSPIDASELPNLSIISDQDDESDNLDHMASSSPAPVEDISMVVDFSPNILSLGDWVKSHAIAASQAFRDELAHSVWPMHQRMKPLPMTPPNHDQPSSPHRRRRHRRGRSRSIMRVTPRGLDEDEDRDQEEECEMNECFDVIRFASEILPSSPAKSSILSPGSLFAHPSKPIYESPLFGATKASILISELELEDDVGTSKRGKSNSSTLGVTPSTASSSAPNIIQPFRSQPSLSSSSSSASIMSNPLLTTPSAALQSIAFPTSSLANAAFSSTRPFRPHLQGSKLPESFQQSTSVDLHHQPNAGSIHVDQSSHSDEKELNPCDEGSYEILSTLNSSTHHHCSSTDSDLYRHLVTRRELISLAAILGVDCTLYYFLASTYALIPAVHLVLLLLLFAFLLTRWLFSPVGVPSESKVCLLLLGDLTRRSLLRIVRDGFQQTIHACHTEGDQQLSTYDSTIGTSSWVVISSRIVEQLDETIREVPPILTAAIEAMSSLLFAYYDFLLLALFAFLIVRRDRRHSK